MKFLKRSKKPHHIETNEALEKALVELADKLDISQDDVAEKKSMLRSFGDCLPDSIWIKDRDSRFVHCNKALADFYGTTYDGILGKTDAELIDSIPWLTFDAEGLRLHDEAIMQSGMQHTMLESGVRKGKKFVYLDHKAPWFDADKNVIGVVGTARDVTMREYLGLSLYDKLSDFEAKIKDEKLAEEYSHLVSEYRSFIDRHRAYGGNSGT